MMEFDQYLASFGEVETTPLTKFQQIVGKRLTQSWTGVPHVTHNDSADVTALDAYRTTMAAKVSPLLFLVKAVAGALRAFPTFNASLSPDGKTLVLKHYFHVGIAVDGPLGLLVPVLRDVDRKNLATLAAELADFTATARDKGLPMDVMSGGCITISSLGGIGGTSFTPIINQPEVAILGVTPMRTVAAWDGMSFVPRREMTLSLSYDHRVINGADAARFLRHIDAALQDPAGLAG
ncbi:dihydrolipoamide acetyltransferase [Sphingobium sp. LB126]|nr:dihydrolipoamide acetyltransferase [Sphingobium sp. LB126]